ncbi:MAG: oligosaccharide flippase family protein [Candidatus Hydrogenedens sp.]|jgi:O-antigen/teichoic acid export membrane protein|nr:oligosaccharide flippase family protein [Candidatus Hydrogenedens sp.]
MSTGISSSDPASSTKDMKFRGLVRGSFLSALSILISMAALLITGKLFTNALDQEQVGIFALLLVTSDFLIYATGMGFAASMPRLIAAADSKEHNRIIGSALSGQLLMLALVTLLVFLLKWGPGTPEKLSTHSGWLAVHQHLTLLPLLFVTGCLRDLILAMLAGLNRYGWRAGGIALASLGQVVTVWAFIWLGGGGLRALVCALAGSYGFALLLLWAGLGSSGIPRFSLSGYGKSLRFSQPLYFNQLMNFFHQRFDTVLVSLLAGIASAAIYEMLKRFPLIVNRILNALLVPYLPHISTLIARGERESAAAVLNEATALSAFIGYGAALFFAAIQRVLVPLFFNKSYLSDEFTLFLLLLSASLALQSGLMAQMLIALGRNRAVPAVNMITMLLCILLNLIFIPAYGLPGAAGSAAFSAACSFALLALCTHRAGITVSLRMCIQPALLLSAAALSLYYGMESVWLRLLAPVLFVLLCLLSGLISPVRLYAIARALLPGSGAARD